MIDSKEFRYLVNRKNSLLKINSINGLLSIKYLFMDNFITLAIMLRPAIWTSFRLLSFVRSGKRKKYDIIIPAENIFLYSIWSSHCEYRSRSINFYFLSHILLCSPEPDYSCDLINIFVVNFIGNIRTENTIRNFIFRYMKSILTDAIRYEV